MGIVGLTHKYIVIQEFYCFKKLYPNLFLLNEFQFINPSKLIYNLQKN